MAQPVPMLSVRHVANQEFIPLSWHVNWGRHMRAKLLIAVSVTAVSTLALTPASAQVRSAVSSATQTVSGAVGGVTGSGANSQNPYAALNDTTAASPGGTAPGG